MDMHPNGNARLRMAFSDVNPPVHAWAAGASTKSIARAAALPIAPFWKKSSQAAP